MKNYLLIEVAPDGTMIPSIFEYSDYDAACAAQELNEALYPDYCYLVYTADEWIYHCENNH